MLGMKGILIPKLLSLKTSNEKLELREELGLVGSREEGKSEGLPTMKSMSKTGEKGITK